MTDITLYMRKETLFLENMNCKKMNCQSSIITLTWDTDCMCQILFLFTHLTG